MYHFADRRAAETARPRQIFMARALAGLVATGLVWAASVSAQSPATQESSSQEPSTSQNGLELEPCHLKNLSEWAECGTFEVLENRDDPTGRRLQLKVAVLPAAAQPALPDPIFLLAGGPGQSAVSIATLAKRTLGPANKRRDIVLVDQRGTGESSPFECDLDFEALAFDNEAKRIAVTECVDGFEGDPLNFRTLDYVRDLEEVRKAIGAEKIHLYGGSYGTRVAQVYLREFPQALATATMDGVASMEIRVGLQMGADAQRSMDILLGLCEDDATCSARFPDLKQRLERLLADLEQTPQEVQFVDPATGQSGPTRMDHQLFGFGLRPLLYGSRTQRLIPLLIEQAEQGNWLGFAGVGNMFMGNLEDSMNLGLLLAVLCTEDLAGLVDADISQEERDSFVGSTQADEFLGYCAAWPQPPERADFSTVVSDVPVLLLSGGLDPATPPYFADQVAKGLTNSRHLVVETGGHVVGSMGCLPDLISEFLDTREPDSLDADCLSEITFPSFFVSAMGPTS